MNKLERYQTSNLLIYYNSYKTCIKLRCSAKNGQNFTDYYECWMPTKINPYISHAVTVASNFVASNKQNANWGQNEKWKCDAGDVLILLFFPFRSQIGSIINMETKSKWTSNYSNLSSSPPNETQSLHKYSHAQKRTPNARRVFTRRWLLPILIMRAVAVFAMRRIRSHTVNCSQSLHFAFKFIE